MPAIKASEGSSPATPSIAEAAAALERLLLETKMLNSTQSASPVGESGLGISIIGAPHDLE